MVNQPEISKLIESNVKLTPMMKQYFEVKKSHEDSIVMFRMGDFYELFFDDARLASQKLNISLTHRGKLGDVKIPMAGIPHHAASNYIDRLTSQGFKVAICEQVEDPKKAKGIVKRAVTQIASPGIPFDLDQSPKEQSFYIACGIQIDDHYYGVFLDFTTGDFLGEDYASLRDFSEGLEKYGPKEFISFMGQWDSAQELVSRLSSIGALNTYLSKDFFDESYNSETIKKLIPHYKKDETLKQKSGYIGAIAAMAQYVCSTQNLDQFKHLRPFRIVSKDNHCQVTTKTLKGLEILPKTKELYAQSLLGFMDQTQTALGSRALKKIFTAPTRDQKFLGKQFDFIQWFLDHSDLRENIISKLKEVRDIERILAKNSTGKINGGDLIQLAKATSSYCDMSKVLPSNFESLSEKVIKSDLTKLVELQKKIEKTINEEVGATLEKGNLIKGGVSKKRDRLQDLSVAAGTTLIELETKLRKKTNISNLKIKHNNVQGYFIEISKSHLSKVPKTFVRKQTLVNNERYQTQELIEFEKEVVTAKTKLLNLDREIFSLLTKEVTDLAQVYLVLAKKIAYIDVISSLAEVAFEHNFVRPTFSKKKEIRITQGFHPLIKKTIKDQFVGHNITLNQKGYFGLITGPNMAGKTTVMREVAIITFLAQIGSFVSAEKAHLWPCDYLFSRLGASDDITTGQSTFMVEMSETAEIIRHATKDSLVLLDEIGRGTSTYDGLSIAASLVEYFVNNIKSFTLFSTHYHELIELAEQLEGAKNLTVKTLNQNGEIKFLYELVEKGASQSFGLHVAKLAGLPPTILQMARRELARLESEANKKGVYSSGSTDLSQLDMFSIPTEEKISLNKGLKEESAILDGLIGELREMDINSMTPLNALNEIHRLKNSIALQ